MKLYFAVALNLALVAVAAPTPLKLKRDDGDSPEGDLTSKIADGSLKSVAQMMNLYKENAKDEAKAKGNANTNVPDYGNTMPIDMTPDDMATFPSADEEPAFEGETKGSQSPAPVEAEKDRAAASPSASAAATPSSTAPSVIIVKPHASEEGEDEDVEDKQKQESNPAASPSPSPTTSKKHSMLESLPIVGGLSGVTGLLGGGSGA